MKKGNIFLIEFLVGSLILLSYLVYIQPFMRSSIDFQDTVGTYAKESMNLIKNTKTEKFGNNTIDAIPDEDYCPKCTLSEQIANLLLLDKYVEASNTTNQTLFYLIPAEFGYNISLQGQGVSKEVSVQNGQRQDTLIVSSTLVSGLNQSTRNAYILQLKVWG